MGSKYDEMERYLMHCLIPHFKDSFTSLIKCFIDGRRL